MGDLNVIREASEKEGGRRFTPAKGKIVNNFIDRVAGIDVGSSGLIFTWRNNRDASHFVREKLDRAISSPLWFLHFPKAAILNLLILASDYTL